MIILRTMVMLVVYMTIPYYNNTIQYSTTQYQESRPYMIKTKSYYKNLINQNIETLNDIKIKTRY